jgi:hypothetical protein
MSLEKASRICKEEELVYEGTGQSARWLPMWGNGRSALLNYF